MNRTLLPASLALLCLLNAPAAVLAQFNVSSRFQHLRVLQYEPIVTTVRVKNLTGREVTVGPGQELEVFFRIETRPGSYVDPRDDGYLFEPFTLGPREERSIVVDLLRSYALQFTGPYTARVHLRFGETTLAGTKQYLDVVPGFELQNIKVPRGGNLSDILDCSLRTLNRGNREQLFLRFDDPGQNVCLGVYHLGSVIRFDPPKIQLDRRGFVHVLHQSAPTRYTHSVHSNEGEPLSKEFHTKGDSSVRFADATDNSLQVKGALPYEGDLSVTFPELPDAPAFR